MSSSQVRIPLVVEQMASRSVEIFEFNELHALHRVIMEAKFSERPTDNAIPGSPLVASVAARVLDTIIEIERDTGGDEKARHWEEWRAATPSRREWKIAVSRVDPNGPWSSWSLDEKKRFAEVLLSPLKATGGLLKQFVEEVDQRVT